MEKMDDKKQILGNNLFSLIIVYVSYDDVK